MKKKEKQISGVKLAFKVTVQEGFPEKKVRTYTLKLLNASRDIDPECLTSRCIPINVEVKYDEEGGLTGKYTESLKKEDF